MNVYPDASISLHLGRTLVSLHQEVAQETFLRLYASLNNGQSIRNTRAWVFTVARNLGLGQCASDSSLLPFDPLEEMQLPDHAADPEKKLLERER